MALKFHKLKVKEKVQETPDAVSLIFEVPDDLRSDYNYLSGQYLTLRFFIDEADQRRAYSFASSPFYDKDLKVTIKEVSSGIVSNHISFFDALLLGGAFKRPVRFVMFEPIYNIPILKQFFKSVGAIPINTQKANPECFENAFKEIKKLLENGEVLCIFPEGKLTADGEIDEFKRGIERMVQETPIPVLPVAIQGLWGSMFSRKNKIRLPRLKWSSLNVVVGDLVKPEDVSAKDLENKVKNLRGDKQ
mgnify:CR=1 FL=1